MQQEEKRKKKLRIFSILAILVVLIGTTYAWLALTMLGEKNHVLRVGSLKLNLDESLGETIQIEKALPITDEEGQNEAGFTFSLENTGIIGSDYTIYLEDEAILEEVTRLADSNIKFSLEKNQEKGKVTYLSQIGANPNRILDSGRLEKGKKNTYTLRIWIADTTTGVIEGQVFRAKLRIEAVQTKGAASYLNAPELASNMIPVVYNEANKRWEKADTASEWYNYDNQMWANAVTVTESTRATYQEASAGSEVKMDDILQMFVWIPRYSYTIKSEDGTNYYGKKETGREDEPTQKLPGEIDVKFIATTSKENGSAKYTGSTTPSGWYTPPAFTFGEKELPGVWVGKFESGATNGTSPGDVTTNNLLAIKPNITSWRSIRVSTLDLVSRGVTGNGNIYGFDSTYDSHAMKNSEWALVSYLIQSKYGKYGNSMYTGANKEIYMNNYTGYQTGCSSGAPSATSSENCIATYDVISDQGDGLGAQGAGASTTGNIYGIYDMNGGAWEYMMGNYNHYSGYTTKSYTAEEAQQLPGHSTETNNIGGPYNSGYTGMCGYDGKEWTAEMGGRSWPDDKYYDLYTTTSVSSACGGGSCKGHALNEVAGWYSDSSTMVWDYSPWFLRGGNHWDGASAGVFYFRRDFGHALSLNSFRLVLTP